MIKQLFSFFDKLEDRVRGWLSHSPILYALIGGVGIILFWRGIWHTADMFSFMSGPLSTVIGAVILLLTGVFVSGFIGNKLIISGLKGEKKLAEKTEEEMRSEESEIKRVENKLNKIETEILEIKKELE